MRLLEIAKLLVPAFVGLITGCASQVAVLDGYQPVDAAIDLRIVDSRPEKEKSSELMSLLITSCDYGIRRLGDETTVPPRMVLLRNDLVRSLGVAAHGKVLTVSHYTIHYNNAAALRGSIYGPGVGLVAAAMQSMGSNCPREKTAEGWYAASELNSPHSPLIVEIVASIDGQQHTVRSIYAPPREFGGRFGEPDAARELFESIKRANTALSESIKSRAGQTQPLTGTSRWRQLGPSVLS